MGRKINNLRNDKYSWNEDNIYHVYANKKAQEVQFFINLTTIQVTLTVLYRKTNDAYEIICIAAKINDSVKPTTYSSSNFKVFVKGSLHSNLLTHNNHKIEDHTEILNDPGDPDYKPIAMALEINSAADVKKRDEESVNIVIKKAQLTITKSWLWWVSCFLIQFYTNGCLITFSVTFALALVTMIVLAVTFCMVTNKSL
ncbi:hypothetical protein RF11_12564 [Thelohanellus kitauei]|uniref:Uncharacterized protein n=1 Tax=Thelohanellus kitauei TaxID=669202 RepID=A0A0C2MKY4_THEKT|nr:hypothetical protein RF11_12564 [Thelohanellus kitauei]